MSKASILTLSGLIILFCSCKKKDSLAGIDKNALFASPTASELKAIEIDWNKRDLTPTNINIEQTHAINSQLDYKLISFYASGYKQYAAILLPVTTTPLPIWFYVAGFSLNDPVSYQKIKTSKLNAIYVIPALKGQSLNITINDTTYKSPVSMGTRNDAFDGAADDIISTLNAVATIFKVDTSKVMVQGGSRGGTVALLVAERDKRVKLSVGVAFASDLLALTASHRNDQTYRFQFLDALLNGSISLTEARKKMIASSPIYFCKHLHKTQIHFGDKDDITPLTQGQMLFNAMKDLGKEDSIEFYIYKGKSHQDIGDNNPEMQERIRKFLTFL
ncbi:dienelactone hydrolase [Chitinophaga sp. W3I9]|uniref:alpha/beta hydrolase family protein n=1 Tax=Chitinophaga sp. W3I9 TaxID=3373924 RepID=UPI003D23B1ED